MNKRAYILGYIKTAAWYQPALTGFSGAFKKTAPALKKVVQNLPKANPKYKRLRLGETHERMIADWVKSFIQNNLYKYQNFYNPGKKMQRGHANWLMRQIRKAQLAAAQKPETYNWDDVMQGFDDWGAYGLDKYRDYISRYLK